MKRIVFLLSAQVFEWRGESRVVPVIAQILLKCRCGEEIAFFA
jgi:hypothetical protein